MAGGAWQEAGCLDLVVRQGEGLGAAADAAAGAASAAGGFRWAVRLPPLLPPLNDPTNTLHRHQPTASQPALPSDTASGNFDCECTLIAVIFLLSRNR